MKLFLNVFLIAFLMPNNLFSVWQTDTILEKIAEAVNMTINSDFNSAEKNVLANIAGFRKKLSKDNFKVKKYSVSYMEARFSMPHNPWGYLLFALIRKLQPDNFIELGTCIGVSGSYVAGGFELNKKGKMFTLETCLPLVPVAQKTFNELCFSRVKVLGGDLYSSMHTVRKHCKKLDMVFDDHIHNEQSVWANFEKIYPHLKDVALYLFDDIDHNVEMKKVWNRIKTDSRATVTISLALGTPYHYLEDNDGVVRPRIGIVIVDKKQCAKKHMEVIIDLEDSSQQVVYKNGFLNVISSVSLQGNKQ